MPKVLGVIDGSPSANYSLQRRDKVTVVNKKWSVRYYVLADDTTQDEEDILATPEIPPLLMYWNGAWVKGYKTKELQTVIHPVTKVKTILWEVTVELDSNMDPNEDKNKNPTSKTPTVRWRGETEEEVLEQDPVTEKPIQTDAEEPIIITTPVVLPVLEIRRYEAYPFNPNIMLDYAHHVNSKPFWGAPPGSALMLPMDVDEEVIEGVRYCVVTYKIKFKIKPGVDEPWKARVLHHGYKYRPAPGKPPVAALDKHGNPITVNLKNGTGEKLPDGSPPEYKEFNRFKKANFNALGLGPF